MTGTRISGLSRGNAGRSQSLSSIGQGIHDKDVEPDQTTHSAVSSPPRKLPTGFQPQSRQQLLEKRQKSTWQRQQAESSSSNLRDPNKEYRAIEDSVPGMFRLSHQQLYVRNLVVQEGKSVFFTGSAGEDSDAISDGQQADR